MKKISAVFFAIILSFALPAGAFKRTHVGEPLKEFKLRTTDGNEFVLMENLGEKATLLVFWAVWSPRSSEALADFQELYNAYAPDGLKVIAVNVDNQTRDAGNNAEIDRLISKLGVEYPVLVDANLTTFDAYGVIAVPSNILTDGEGKIVALLEGYANFTRHDFKDEILKQLGKLKIEEKKPEEKLAYQPKGVAVRYLNMGRLLLKKKMPARAVKAFENAIKQDPDFPDPYLWLSKAFESEGETEKAEKAKEQAIELQKKLDEKAGSGS